MTNRVHKITYDELLEDNNRMQSKIIQMHSQLESARKALEFYANSRIGEKNLDGTYSIWVHNNGTFKVCYTYDPTIASCALKILND